MKIDIQDIKFWMDAIRNSEDKDRTLETFWGGQIQSKLWLIETIAEKNKMIRNAEIVIHGGWNGLLASMLFNSEIGIKKVVSVDVDRSWFHHSNGITQLNQYLFGHSCSH